jgi:hypothetical protein
MFKFLLTSSLSIIAFTNIFAQTDKDLKNQYKIFGKIIEASSEKGLPYATIQVFNIRKENVAIATSDILGDFILHLKKSGSYLLKFDAMGYGADSLELTISEPVNNVGIIKLVEGQQLAGVKISAKKLIMKQELDKLVYDVTNDPEAKRLKMSDIMKKIPFMSINSTDGKLKYLDNNVSIILIDGKPNDMISGARQFPMNLIKGDVMSKIEVILPGTRDNPGERPIVNIKLARELPNGYAVELGAIGSTQNQVGGNIDLITKFDKLYISLVYGVDYQSRPTIEAVTTKENLNDEAVIYLQKNSSVSWGNNISHRIGVGASYLIAKKDKVGLSLSANKSISNNYINTFSENYSVKNELIDHQNSKSTNVNSNIPKVNGSFYYRHTLDGRGFLLVSYNITNNMNNSNYSLLTNKSDMTDPDHQTSKGGNSTVDQSATFTFSKKYDTKHLIEVIGSYTNRDYSSNSEFEYWNYDTQNLEKYYFRQEGLNYIQELYSARGRYNYMNNNLSINFNISAEKMVNRGVFHSTEDSQLDYKEVNLFPSINVVYRTKHRYKIGLNYGTRTLRPNINYLNPYLDNSDPKNITVGNPNLKAEYAHRIQISISKNFGNSISTRIESKAEFTNNAIERVTTINAQNISTTSYSNIGQKEDYITAIDFVITPFSWLSILNFGNIRHTRYTSTINGIKNNVTGFGYIGNINFKLLKSTSISGSFNISPQINSAQTKEVKYYNSVDFSLYQTLIKNKLFLTLSLSEPFNSHRYISNMIGNSYYNMSTTREMPGRIWGFRLRWSFGRLRDKLSMPGIEAPPADLVRPDLTAK